jgi:hypothetical protein
VEEEQLLQHLERQVEVELEVTDLHFQVEQN